MDHRTGSVYLDTPPRQSRMPVASTGSQVRMRAASTVVTIGVVALSAALAIIGIRMMALNPDAAAASFDSALEDPVARAEIEREIAYGIEHDLVGDEMTEVAAAYGLDVGAESERVAALIAADPGVQGELRNLAEDLHSRAFIEHDPTPVELEALTEASLEAIADESPRLASVIPADATLWVIDPESLADFTPTMALLDQILLVALLAILLIPAGVAFHPERHRVAGAIGRWGLVFGLTGALAAIGLPYAASALTGYTYAEIAVRSTSRTLLVPALVIGVVGMGLVSVAAFLRHRAQRRVAQEGAQAAMGYDEPQIGQQRAGATLDLPSRGLVDVNHPLTNI